METVKIRLHSALLMVLVLAALGAGAAGEDAAAWKTIHLDVVPTPKQCLASGREFHFNWDAKIVIVARGETPIARRASEVLVGYLRRKGLRNVETTQGEARGDVTIILGGDAPKLRPQGYSLQALGESAAPPRVAVTVAGVDDLGALYGVYTLLKALRFTPDGPVIRELQVTDEPALRVRGLSPQWAWYLGERAPFGEDLWGLDRWKTALDLMCECRFNMLALCTYGKFPFPLERYRSRCAVDLPFELWNPERGLHTIRWTHPAFKDDFLGALVEYAHGRGIQVLIYSCLNLQDEIGSHRWTNEEEISAYCDIQQHLLKRCGIDGFIFESGEFHVTHPDDLARFGNDQWTRLKADVFLTRRYTEAIRAAKPHAVIGLVDHYLFRDWDEKKVPQRVGLERWKAELPPETLVAYVHSSEAYDVFPPDRVWTYVFGPKGGLKPALQIHLADSCDMPREKRAAGAYYVTYDWTPHEPDYLCFAESAWGNYDGADDAAFLIHSSEGGVGGPISGRVWGNIKRDLYGEGADFGEGLLAAAKGTSKGMWDPIQVLRKAVFGQLVPALDEGDFGKAEALLAEVAGQRAATEKGLGQMVVKRGKASAQMITKYPIQEHLDKAILLAQTQLAWAEFVRTYYETAIALARNAGDARNQVSVRNLVSGPINDLRAVAVSAHGRIREALSRAYFSYPHDKLGKFEFLANPDPFLADMQKLRIRFSLAIAPNGTRLRLRNVSPQAKVTADSNFPSRYGPGYYAPAFAADGRQGTPAKGIWVSAETATPHFLELQFDRPPTVRGIVVTWAKDEAHDWTPRSFSIEVCVDGKWRPVLEVKENSEPIAVARLDPPVLIERVRVEITRGSPSRPRLAAVNEVEVLAVLNGR